MDRRTVLLHFVYGSAGVLLWPACKSKPTLATDYPHLQLTTTQVKWIEHYSQALLPNQRGEIGVLTDVGPFVLTMVNALHGPEDISKFKEGLEKLKEQTENKYKADFTALTTAQRLELIKKIDETEEHESALIFYHKTVKNYAVQHFTGSKFFLTEHRGYAMIPGPYQGCVQL